jgi:hypothetical protein
VGATTGLIKNNKVGDLVVELGADCVAAGEKFVVEAKEDAGYFSDNPQSNLATEPYLDLPRSFEIRVTPAQPHRTDISLAWPKT